MIIITTTVLIPEIMILREEILTRAHDNLFQSVLVFALRWESYIRLGEVIAQPMSNSHSGRIHVNPKLEI